jgi:hypothetical protein
MQWPHLAFALQPLALLLPFPEETVSVSVSVHQQQAALTV